MKVALSAYLFFGVMPSPAVVTSQSFGQSQHLRIVGSLNCPPGLYEGITVTPAQTEKIKKLDREFAPIIDSQIQRAEQLRLHDFGSVGLAALQAGQERLILDFRSTVLTPSQRIVFDKNRAARKEYSDRRRAERERDAH